MSGKRKLEELCYAGLKKKGIEDQRYQQRLNEELREVNDQDEHEYFLDLYDRCQTSRSKISENQNNLLIPYLLDIVPDFDINRDPEYVYGEYPDIDTDFHPAVRDYIKNEFIPQKFGRDHVCSIGNYATFGIKSSLIDMAKVHDLDRNEILALTTKLGLKDDEGNQLTFDKALDMFPDLADYCNRHPEVAEAAKKIAHRMRSMGTHAAGIVISKDPLDEIVPLVRSKEDFPTSAWIEGQSGQDLGPMGLIKFDFLVITKMESIALCCKRVKERYGIKHICSDPNVNRDWSDTCYLEDPKSLELAHKGDLLGIFQFDSPGIRRLCRGNVTEFNDMVAINAIYRPGPLSVGFDQMYFKRKKGEEKYQIHPLLEPVLRKTYGLYVYQESIMQILDIVGNIPPKDCLVVLKGIAKKKIDKIRKYKDMFVENGCRNLGVSEKEILALWDDIEKQAAYSFNMSHSVAYTYVAMRSLYLKAHYPLEFYEALLACENDGSKIKEYIIDARQHGIRINRCDLNKSKERFCICDEDNQIYTGYANLRGIGDPVAEHIVSLQPYNGIEDFIKRFGSDSRILIPLIALGIFGQERFAYYQYYETYRKWLDKHKEKTYRNKVSKKNLLEKLIVALPDGLKENATFEDTFFDENPVLLEDKKIKELRSKYSHAISLYEKNLSVFPSPSYDTFVPKDEGLSDRFLTVLRRPMEEIELEYYGFSWSHPLAFSPDFQEINIWTFQKHRESTNVASPVDGVIRTVASKNSRNGNVYYQLKFEDVLSEFHYITVFQDDYEKFQEWFVEGSLVRMLLKAPEKGFSSYTLCPLPWKQRRSDLFKDKSNDFRVIQYQAAVKPGAYAI